MTPHPHKSAGPRAAAPAEPAVAPSLVAETVLLGMVDPELYDTLWRALRADGIASVRARDGAAVLRMVRETRPSLVILELYLPGSGALETCTAIRGECGDDLPVIIVAAQADATASAAAGVTDWLVKPFSAIYARTRMRAWLWRSACRWLRPPLPPDEAPRLAALHRLALLDTPREERFDRLTRIAAAVFEVPVALVSLIDAERQWFKSACGTEIGSSPREISFCAHAILNDAVMVVPDALNDPRFADNPVVVDGPRVRFYAGCPLAMPNGSRVGTLCIIDIRPRQLGSEGIALLRDLAGLVREELLRGIEP